MNELLAVGGMALLAISSVGLWTLRVALTARGRKTMGATVAAVEAVTFAVAFTNVSAHLHSPVRVAGYAAGVALGTILGLTADQRLSPRVSDGEGVSKAVFVSDSDGHLIEIYVDAQPEEWRDDPTLVANASPPAL